VRGTRDTARKVLEDAQTDSRFLEDSATLAAACQSVLNDGDKVAEPARADQVAVLTEKAGSC
jgi:hypothetical protein